MVCLGHNAVWKPVSQKYITGWVLFLNWSLFAVIAVDASISFWLFSSLLFHFVHQNII